MKRQAPKPKRARTKRRERERQLDRLQKDQERLFELEPGGNPEHPIVVDSASVVEIRARATRCPHCDSEQGHTVEEHRAAKDARGNRLREARLICPLCRTRRSLWFRLPVVN